MDGPLRGRARHRARDDVAGRLGVDLRGKPTFSNQAPWADSSSAYALLQKMVLLSSPPYACTETQLMMILIVQGGPIFYHA